MEFGDLALWSGIFIILGIAASTPNTFFMWMVSCWLGRPTVFVGAIAMGLQMILKTFNVCNVNVSILFDVFDDAIVEN